MSIEAFPIVLRTFNAGIFPIVDIGDSLERTVNTILETALFLVMLGVTGKFFVSESF